MSIGSLGGLLGSAAGAPLSQTTGSETERTQKDALQQNRQADANEKADLASGIGQTDKDEQASERDADGRRLWELQEKAGKERGVAEAADLAARQSKDASGQSGTKLDLTG